MSKKRAMPVKKPKKPVAKAKRKAAKPKQALPQPDMFKAEVATAPCVPKIRLEVADWVKGGYKALQKHRDQLVQHQQKRIA